MIRRWTHLISVEPTGDGTLSSDHVEIDAGILTPFIAAFAHWFSGHLQKRWRKLVAVGFSDGEAQDQPKAR
ncbi:hypothetical protein [Paracoccus tegillarcae]|uniref:Uncharacterized protein n=1 Tax=Paracoccus tegillarcae TaxID=1529068 RepID=A0A2K9EBM1_9RHOB|nr:hypothetical protein [Paracoccus tegillarcae]AUH32298.1 hypothetical protein CUV01_01815 [Paracoccus tegillarcae]